MPNTFPNTTTRKEFEKKFKLHQRIHSQIFHLCLGTNDNIDEIKKLDAKEVAGIKLF